MKASEQYLSMVVLVMMHKMVLTCETVDEIINRDHLNESYFAVVYCILCCKGCSNFEVC